jgi:hypothetical protein
MPYAQHTKVPVIQSQAEIERLVVKHGGDQFLCGWTAEAAQVGFRIQGRMLKFLIPMPDTTGRGADQRRRRLWRALLLVIKAKFEIVESGIETFDEAFLSNIVMSDGSTVGDWAAPQIAAMYAKGDMPPLLTGPKQ